ncbi:MAG TPA: TIGR03085 family metal-binding protein [Candidatus Nanopelagicales bacterium]|nr:TIGR03085 family metal-binding protein [Candidatus Nanopelagicales bacterium]
MTASTGPPPNAAARSERHALADLMGRLGPDAPTCAGEWTARDLAAHLVLRERRMDAAAGISFGALAGWTARVQRGLAGQDWDRLVGQVRAGPPAWSPLSLASIDGGMNTIEFFVHHEDLRRGGGQWEPRELAPVVVGQLWEALRRGVRLIARHSPVAITARPSDGPAAGSQVRLRQGEREVTLVGEVGECVLAVYGRPSRVAVEGEPADVAAFHAFER